MKLYFQQTVEAWQHIFYLTAAINVAGTIFYLIFGSGKRQAWASPTEWPSANDITKKSGPNQWSSDTDIEKLIY